MMQQLRNFSKAFLIFVVIAFVGSIIFAWGMDIGRGSQSRGYVATVNDEEVEPQTYENLVSNLRQQYNQGGMVNLDWTNEVVVRQQAWDQMVRDIVLQQYMDQLGLSVSDRELYNYLMNYPPQYLWNDPNFQTDGQFDMQKYRQFITDPAYSQTVAYIEQQEVPRILRMQLSELMRSAIQITPEEMMREFRKNNEQIKIEYAMVTLNSVSDPEVELDSAQVREYYEAHTDQYKREPQAELDYVAFEVDPTQADSSNVSDLEMWIAQARDAEQDIFPGLASIVSDDTRAQSTGGNMGWIKKGRYPELDSIAFELDSGQIYPEPILMPHGGYRIIKSYGTRTSDDGEQEVHLYQITKNIKPSPDTFSDFYTKAATLHDEAVKIGLDSAAAKYGYSIRSSGPFYEGNAAGNIGGSPEANEFAFSAKKGQLSDVIMVANPRSGIFRLVVTKLKERKPERTLSFEDAYEFAANDLRHEALLDRAYETAQKIAQEAKQSMDLRGAADKYNAEFEATDFFTRVDMQATKYNSDPQFMGAAFSLLDDDKMVTDPVYTRTGVAVITRTGKVFNPAEFDMQRQQIYNAIWAQKVRATTQNWTQELMQDADIEDYRNLPYIWAF